MTKRDVNDPIFNDSRILVVDDEEMLLWSIETELKAHGAQVFSSGTLRRALELFDTENPDVVICDLRLPDGSGLELLKKCRNERPDIGVILITAHGGVDSAIDALRLGAFDYLQKPFDMKSLIAAAKRATELSRLRQKVKRLTGYEQPRAPLELVGSSPAMEDVKQRLRRVAESRSRSVLITGESGTGKELAARAIHEWSSHNAGPFVEINCASIPENLLESELFGYEKGAFTDARDRKLGLFEMAQNGTIFLDEIGELPLKLQSKLLRALEYRRFKRLGGTKEIVFNARIVTATNRDLLVEVQEKRFRQDLYYRLSALPIKLPALRDRKSDIPQLVDFFLKQISQDLSIPKPAMSSSLESKMTSHNWPGNIRELKNVLERSLVFHQPSVLEANHIEIDRVPESANFQHSISHDHRSAGYGSLDHGHLNSTGSDGLGPDNLVDLPDSGLNLEGLERSLLVQALDKARNNQTKAAALLGISRHTFRYRLEKYGLVNH